VRFSSTLISREISRRILRAGSYDHSDTLSVRREVHEAEGEAEVEGEEEDLETAVEFGSSGMYGS
jgi:hypothetical protein